MIKVLYFARLREQLGQASDQLPWDAGLQTLEQVRQRLCQLHPQRAEALGAKDLLVACNQDMVNWQSPVQDGDEIALFPPVTGG